MHMNVSPHLLASLRYSTPLLSFYSSLLVARARFCQLICRFFYLQLFLILYLRRLGKRRSPLRVGSAGGSAATLVGQFRVCYRISGSVRRPRRECSAEVAWRRTRLDQLTCARQQRCARFQTLLGAGASSSANFFSILSRVVCALCVVLSCLVVSRNVFCAHSVSYTWCFFVQMCICFLLLYPMSSFPLNTGGPRGLRGCSRGPNCGRHAQARACGRQNRCFKLWSRRSSSISSASRSGCGRCRAGESAGRVFEGAPGSPARARPASLDYDDDDDVSILFVLIVCRWRWKYCSRRRSVLRRR